MKPLKESFIKAKDLDKIITPNPKSLKDIRHGDIVTIRDEWSDINCIYIPLKMGSCFFGYDFDRKFTSTFKSSHFVKDFPYHDESHRTKILKIIGHYDDYADIKFQEDLIKVLSKYK